MIAVKIGMARMEIEEGNWVEVALGRGFAEVVNNRVTLLVDTAEKPEEIDIRHAQEQKERAEERIRQKQSIQEYYHSQASLARAMNRLRVSQGKRWNYREKKQGSCAKGAASLFLFTYSNFYGVTVPTNLHLSMRNRRACALQYRTSC